MFLTQKPVKGLPADTIFICHLLLGLNATIMILHSDETYLTTDPEQAPV